MSRSFAGGFGRVGVQPATPHECGTVQPAAEAGRPTAPSPSVLMGGAVMESPQHHYASGADSLLVAVDASRRDAARRLDARRRVLMGIEAVTSHGPIGLKRHNELKDLFKAARAGLVFVTAFLTRRAMTKYLGEIAWETEVWVADAPSHIIHFNGERFLGPYDQRI